MGSGCAFRNIVIQTREHVARKPLSIHLSGFLPLLINQHLLSSQRHAMQPARFYRYNKTTSRVSNSSSSTNPSIISHATCQRRPTPSAQGRMQLKPFDLLLMLALPDSKRTEIRYLSICGHEARVSSLQRACWAFPLWYS